MYAGLRAIFLKMSNNQKIKIATIDANKTLAPINRIFLKAFLIKAFSITYGTPIYLVF